MTRPHSTRGAGHAGLNLLLNTGLCLSVSIGIGMSLSQRSVWAELCEAGTGTRQLGRGRRRHTKVDCVSGQCGTCGACKGRHTGGRQACARRRRGGAAEHQKAREGPGSCVCVRVRAAARRWRVVVGARGDRRLDGIAVALRQCRHHGAHARGRTVKVVRGDLGRVERERRSSDGASRGQMAGRRRGERERERGTWW